MPGLEQVPDPAPARKKDPVYAVFNRISVGDGTAGSFPTYALLSPQVKAPNPEAAIDAVDGPDGEYIVTLASAVRPIKVSSETKTVRSFG
jgi:hypothetical protein